MSIINEPIPSKPRNRNPPLQKIIIIMGIYPVLDPIPTTKAHRFKKPSSLKDIQPAFKPILAFILLTNSFAIAFLVASVRPAASIFSDALRSK